MLRKKKINLRKQDSAGVLNIQQLAIRSPLIHRHFQSVRKENSTMKKYNLHILKFKIYTGQEHLQQSYPEDGKEVRVQISKQDQKLHQWISYTFKNRMKKKVWSNELWKNKQRKKGKRKVLEAKMQPLK